MKKIILDINNAPVELRKGLQILSAYTPLAFKGTGIHLSFRKGKGLRIMPGRNGCLVEYESSNQAFRAVGIMLGALRQGKPVPRRAETQQFSLLNVMMDVSRNAVMTVPALKEWLARMALMGLNSFMLYAETVYEVPGEPYFGYGLGRYTARELRELDGHARSLGIEMIPCIQTLAHLRRILCYEVYGKVKDFETVLLVDEAATYKLIGKMIRAATAPFRSRRIHIGMDEAWGLGLGAYLKRFGYRDGHAIMLRHFPRVVKMLKRLGLKPMMWGDMYFRAASKTGDYYDPAVRFSPSLKRKVPRDIQLIYWDYYHFGKKTYKSFLRKHQALNPDTILAPGLQTWNRLWTNYPYAMETAGPALAAAKEEKVREIVMTLWGDDGNECDYYSALPMLQFYAEHGFNRDFDQNIFENNLLGSCGIRYAGWEPSGRMDVPPFAAHPKSNVSKCLLWEDPAHGLYQPQLEGRSLNGYYAGIGKKLSDARLAFPRQVCRVLSVKADFPSRLRKAYGRKDRAGLTLLLRKDIPFMKREIAALRRIHSGSWHSIYKPQGWAVLDCRYGGLLARLETLEQRLKGYLAGRLERLGELEEKRLKIYPSFKGGNLPGFGYGGVYSNTFVPVN